MGIIGKMTLMNLNKTLLLAVLSLSQVGCFFGAAVGSSFVVQSTVATGASYAVSGKGLTDHAMSEIADKNCKMFNVVDAKSVCQEYKKIPINDKNSRPELTSGATIQ